MASNAARPVWVKQAEEAKLKEEQEKSAAAWEAFNSTFKDVNVGAAETLAEKGGDEGDSDSEEDEAQILANKPIGPVDPGKCTAAGTGVAGGAAGAAASFVIVTKDGYGRRVLDGGAVIKVKVIPAAGVSGGEVEQEAVVKDHGDGTYTVTYAVAKRGNYVVSVECNGSPILNSPFPVFFSGGTAAVPMSTPTTLLGSSSFVNGMGQSPYLGGLPGMYPTGVANMPGLSQMPLAPSAAAMAAAQAIMAARAYEAAQAREAAAHGSSASKDSKEDEEQQKELLTRTLQVSNLSSMLSADQLKTLFSFCGTVSDCKIDDSKQLAYIEYTKPEEAKAALALNNMGVGGRPLNVEMAKSLPLRKPSTGPSANGLPVMMQQAVAIQQFHFQQALLVQQAVASQHAALQAATAKTASETAVARAAEISKSLNITGNDQEEKDTPAKRSPSRPRRSKSPSPIRYRPRHRSRSLSRSPIRYRRGRRSRSPSRDRPRYGSDDRGRAWFYRSGEDYYRSQTRHFRDRERDYEQRNSSHRRSPVRSKRKAGSRSPKTRKNHSRSPRPRTEEFTEKARSTHTKAFVREGHEKRDREHAEKTSSRRKEPMSPSVRKSEKTHDERSRLSASPKFSSPRRGKTPDFEGVELEEPARAYNDGGSEVKLPAKAYDELEAKQPDTSYDDRAETVKVAEVDDRGRVDSKERRHHERKHRKDEDSETRDRKKRRHKHRSRRSSSDSAEVRHLVDGGKSKTDRDDGSGHRKSSKKKSRRSRSASISNSGGD
eukprot:c25190_g1_i2 orf=121-2430(+)